MSPSTISYIVWGFVGSVFAAFEFASRDVLGWAPWYSLSGTAWGLEGKSKWVSILIITGLAVLIVHIVFGKDGPAG